MGQSTNSGDDRGGKDADWMLSNLDAGEFDWIFATEASSPRSVPSADLASVASKYCSKTCCLP